MAAYTWTGSAGDGDLGNAANFSPAKVPAASDVLTIPKVTKQPSKGTCVAAATVSAGATVSGGQFHGSVNVVAATQIQGATIIGRTYVNGAQIQPQGFFPGTLPAVIPPTKGPAVLLESILH